LKLKQRQQAAEETVRVASTLAFQMKVNANAERTYLLLLVVLVIDDNIYL
jgi:hypothetical protein